MAGHSKFKNIMHRKGRQDAVRSKMFAKLSKEITVASKMGGPDPVLSMRIVPSGFMLEGREEEMEPHYLSRIW